MIFTIWRNGRIEPGQHEGLPHDKAEIEAESSAFLVSRIDEGIYLTREGGSTDVHLVIFKQDRALKPRVIKLHDIPVEDSLLKTIQVIFNKLLSFDNNRLSNRDRNIAITIIRSFLPKMISGTIERQKGDLVFKLYNDLLSVFTPQGNCLTRLGYASFSRTIKDNL